MIILLVFFLIGVYSQQVCNPLVFEGYEVNTLILGDFAAKGGSGGRLAVAGDAILEQFSVGTKLPNSAEYSLVVHGDLDFKCGDSRANVYYSGELSLGARVDMDSNPSQVAENSVVSFVNSRTYYEDMNEALIDLALESPRGSSQGGVLYFVGDGSDVSLFRISCNDLASSRTLFFAGIGSSDSSEIIINVLGTGHCTMNLQSIQGLSFPEPAAHILWNFQASSLTIQGNLVGSVLAPHTTVTSRDELYIEGQAIIGEFNGTAFFGSYRFRGCVPSDTCFVGAQNCPPTVMPNPCLNAQTVPDPNRPCCTIFQCDESCPDPPQCPPVLECRAGWVVEVTIPAGNDQGDPCCDVYGCVRDTTVTQEDPRNTFCPLDIEITLQAGSSQIEVNWEEPTWTHISSVSSNFVSGQVFPVGEEIVEYVALGLKPDTMTYCMFAVNIIQTSMGTSCQVGGQVYDNGDIVTDDCNSRCVCINGNLENCVRVRKELQSMTPQERRHYFSVFLSVYHANDGTIKRYIDNHQQFFSRGLHNNGAFLPWHRGYILETENRLREADCRVTVPYWNWRITPRISRSNIFGLADHQASGNGDSGTRCVRTGTFGFESGFRLTTGRCLQRRISGGSTATIARVQQLINRYPRATQFDSFRNRLEHGPGLHDSVHCLVGGTMCSSRSSNDPVFFSHHANIDKIWDEWQQTSTEHLNFYSGNTNANSLMPISPWTPRQLLNLLEQPDGVSVHYDVPSQAEGFLNDLIRQMSEEELASIGNAEVGPVGQQFLEDMNMPVNDQNVIAQAEELANRDVVREIVALTLQRGVERTLGTPGLEEAMEAVSMRLAQEYRGEIPIQLDARLIFRALTDVYTASNIVPRFTEIQNIIVNDLDGNEIETVAVPVEIDCTTLNSPVCAHGITFPSECQANNEGYNVDSFFACPPPEPLPEPVDPEIDEGVSDAYNHGVQELSECPPSIPPRFSRCEVLGVQCFYGLECCTPPVSQTTVSCTHFLWFITSLPWRSCSDARCAGSEDQGPQNPGESVELLPRVTLSPTSRPTRSPTLSPTRSPTRPPTRNPTPAPTWRGVNSARVTLSPTTVPQAPPPPPPPPPPISLRASQSILPSAHTRFTRTATLRTPSTGTSSTGTSSTGTSSTGTSTRTSSTGTSTTRRNVVPSQSRSNSNRRIISVSPPVVGQPSRSSVNVVSSIFSSVTSLAPVQPLVVIPPVCPTTGICGPTPTCCTPGFEVGRMPIMNTAGQECGQSCPQCLRILSGNEYIQGQVPECCLAELACSIPECGDGETLELVRSRGANNVLPCCDVYRCTTAVDICASRTCPTLEMATCNSFQVPRYTEQLDSLGCCRMVACVWNFCSGRTQQCGGGITVEQDPTGQPPCSYPPCPAVCSNPDHQLFCPSTGGTQISRVRNDAPDCSWQDCPDYEPCTDPTYGPLPCGDSGTCVPGFTVLTCECEEHYSGDVCQTFSPPPRPTFTVTQRSFVADFADQCQSFMCHDENCYFSANAGISWEPLDPQLRSISGISTDYAWFVGPDDHIVSFNRMSRQILGSRDLDAIYQNVVSVNGLQEARTTYSYFDVVQGDLPPASEREYMMNWNAALSWTGPCQFMVFLTDQHVVFYTSHEMHSTQWGTIVDGSRVDTVELCEDKCLDGNGDKRICSEHGICDRQTGECICDYGYEGDNCERT